MDYPLTTATVEILPNGLTLILDPDSSAPVISTQCWVATGSLHEDEHLGAGLSHFLEHMVFKGTRDYSSTELAEQVQAAGGHWNAYTTFDRTVYYIDGPAHSAEVFLKCLTGLVFFPVLPEADFANEMEVIRREIDMGLDDPGRAQSRLLLATAYIRDPRQHPVIGHREMFDRLVYQDLVSYHQKRYTPDRCHLVISGDFDPELVRASVRDLVAAANSRGGREPWIPQDVPQSGPRIQRETFAVPATHLTMAWKIPTLHHPDAAARDVLATLLGQGRASRLYRELREERSLALEISAFCWQFPDRDGLFAVSAEVEPAQRETLVAAIREQLALLATSPLDAELAKAKRQIATSQFRGLTTASGRASDLASNWHEARDLNFTRQYIHQVERVTVDDIRRVAASLSDEQLTLTWLDPLEVAAPPRAASKARRNEVIETFALANGVTIALVPDHRVPLVHCQVAVRAGLVSETAVSSGLNQLFAATWPKGTQRRSAHELANSLESLGASIGAAAGNSSLSLGASGLSDDLPVILEALAEVAILPAFPDEALQREKASQLTGIEQARLDPLSTAFRALRRTLFSGQGLGLHLLGTKESVTQLNRDALLAHHAKHLNGANITIALAGDFDPVAAREQLEAYWAAAPAGERWLAANSVIECGGSITERLAKKQAALAIGFPGAAVHSEHRHALALIREYASDMAGPLFTRIREELGLAYQIGATEFLGHDTGMFTFYMATAPESVDQAREELLNEIRKIAEHGVPQEAFERVRATLLSNLALQQQSPAVIARAVAIDLLHGLPADHHRQLDAEVRQLTHQQVLETAKMIMGAVDPTMVTVLPEGD